VKRHLNKKAVQATLDEKRKPCPLEGTEMLLSRMRTGERGGGMEGRLRRGVLVDSI
jgi:hypothetical protein